MRTIRATLLLASAAVLIAAAPVGAQVPQKMNYQVMLTDDAGLALVDTAVEIVFRLYTDPADGTLEWTETHSTTTNDIGVVSVILGETTPLDATDFDQPLWLEVEVDGEALTPRRELVSAPYALHSYDSDYLGAVQASDYALDADLVGVGDGHSLDAADGSPIDVVYVNDDGNVGIHIPTPTEDLHIHDLTGLAYLRFTNSTTDSTSIDGFKIGINGAGNAYIHQYETASINFATNGVFAGRFDHNGTFELGNELVSGRFQLYKNGSVEPTAIIENSGDGGTLALFDTGATEVLIAGPDGHGGGAGYLQIRHGGAGTGFLVDGNAGDGDCDVIITGSGSSTTFDTSESGDDSVILPTSAINATEILDEPGAACVTATSPFSLTGGYQVLLERTITSPGPGYVLAIATGRASCAGGSATNGASFGVSPSATSFASGGDILVQIPDTAGAGGWYESVTVHGLFEVTGGSDTFYFLGYRSSGGWSVTDRKLTLIYVPTSYGTVSRTEFAGADSPATGVSPAARPLTESDLAFERSESIAANQARVDAEFVAMKAEIAELRARLDEMNE